MSASRNVDLVATGFLLVTLGMGSVIANHVVPFFSHAPHYVKPAIIEIRDSARGQVREAHEEVRRARLDWEREVRQNRHEWHSQEREIRDDWRRQHEELRREAEQWRHEARRTRDEIRDGLREVFRRPVRAHFE